MIIPEGMRVVVVDGPHRGRAGTVTCNEESDGANRMMFGYLGGKPDHVLVRLDAEAGQPAQPDGTPGRGGRGGATVLIANQHLRAEVAS